jgi:hypothetical protein
MPWCSGAASFVTFLTALLSSQNARHSVRGRSCVSSGIRGMAGSGMSIAMNMREVSDDESSFQDLEGNIDT